MHHSSLAKWQDWLSWSYFSVLSPWHLEISKWLPFHLRRFLAVYHGPGMSGVRQRDSTGSLFVTPCLPDACFITGLGKPVLFSSQGQTDRKLNIFFAVARPWLAKNTNNLSLPPVPIRKKISTINIPRSEMILKSGSFFFFQLLPAHSFIKM